MNKTCLRGIALCVSIVLLTKLYSTQANEKVIHQRRLLTLLRRPTSAMVVPLQEGWSYPPVVEKPTHIPKMRGIDVGPQCNAAGCPRFTNNLENNTHHSISLMRLCYNT